VADDDGEGLMQTGNRPKKQQFSSTVCNEMHLPLMLYEDWFETSRLRTSLCNTCKRKWPT
jgi:hypothetical protein